MNDTATAPPRPRAGLLESALQRLFTRAVRVVDVEDVGPAFRLVTLGGEALRGADWTPGDKIQLQLGGWVQRTWTPIDWDAGSGCTRVLAHLHAGGPGTRWARAARPGDDGVLFGPRKSIRLARPSAPVILFGDETSLGLAVALAGSGSMVHGLFEVAASADAQPAIERLRIAIARCVVRRDGDAHFIEIERRLAAMLQAEPAAEIVLTGRAAAIQHVGRWLQGHGIGPARRQTKAYWAAGKSGLD